ncbi:MAG: hypothetical protein AAFZ46_12285 [Pseudomonadota bacterium]
MYDTRGPNHNSPLPSFAGIDWQDISTAPLDGSWVAVWSRGGIPDVARFNVEMQAWETVEHVAIGEITYESWPLTDWAPLPGGIDHTEEAISFDVGA